MPAEPWDEIFDGLLHAHLPWAVPDRPVPPDVELVSLGADSLALLNLLMAVERTYAIELPTELLTEEVFRTGRSLWTAIQGVRSGTRS
jgi:diaminopimelate decarboxylase